MSDVEKDIETVACRMVGMNEQHALQAWTNLIRLARLGAAVEEAYKLLDNHTVDETQFTTLVQTVVEQQEAT